MASGSEGVLELLGEGLCANSWAVVGEGAVHVVVEFTGKSRPESLANQQRVRVEPNSGGFADKHTAPDIDRDGDILCRSRTSNFRLNRSDLRRYVVRIPKDVVAARTISEKAALASAETFHRSMRSRHVYSLPVQKLWLPDDFICSLDAHIFPMRGAARTKTGARLDIARQLGWLIPKASLAHPTSQCRLFCSGKQTEPVVAESKANHHSSASCTTLDAATVSIELKPKSAALPNPCFVSRAVKLRHSKFFLKQFVKMSAVGDHHPSSSGTAPSTDQTQQERIASRGSHGQQPKLQQRSYYDPLLLFSGNRDLIAVSLRNASVTPQNNFRVFAGGQRIYGQEELNEMQHHQGPPPEMQVSGSSTGGSAPSSDWDCLSPLSKALQRYFVERKHIINGKRITKRADTVQINSSCFFPWDDTTLIEAVSSILSVDEFLPRLLEIQKRDTFGIEYVGEAYEYLLAIAGSYVDGQVDSAFSVNDHLEEILAGSLALQIESAANVPELSRPARRFLLYLCGSGPAVCASGSTLESPEPFSFRGSTSSAMCVIRAIRNFLLAHSADDVSVFITLVPEPQQDAPHLRSRVGPQLAHTPHERSISTSADAMSRMLHVWRPLPAASKSSSRRADDCTCATTTDRRREWQELKFSYQVSCIDFDCKPARFIPKYLKQDLELCSLFPV